MSIETILSMYTHRHPHTWACWLYKKESSVVFVSFKKESSVVFVSFEKELNDYDTVTCVTVHCRLWIVRQWSIHSPLTWSGWAARHWRRGRTCWIGCWGQRSALPGGWPAPPWGSHTMGPQDPRPAAADCQQKLNPLINTLQSSLDNPTPNHMINTLRSSLDNQTLNHLINTRQSSLYNPTLNHLINTLQTMINTLQPMINTLQSSLYNQTLNHLINTLQSSQTLNHLLDTLQSSLYNPTLNHPLDTLQSSLYNPTLNHLLNTLQSSLYNPTLNHLINTLQSSLV